MIICPICCNHTLEPHIEQVDQTYGCFITLGKLHYHECPDCGVLGIGEDLEKNKNDQLLFQSIVNIICLYTFRNYYGQKIN